MFRVRTRIFFEIGIVTRSIREPASIRILLRYETYILQEASRMLERKGVGNSNGRERSSDPSVGCCRST